MVDLAADYNLELLATGVVLLDADLHIRALNLSAENLLEVSIIAWMSSIFNLF